MKNIVMLSAILAVVSVPAAAVQKCVALGSSTTCTSGSTRPPTGKTDWALTCTTSKTSVPVSGIGVCSVSLGTTSSPVSSLNSTAMSTATDPDTCYVGDALNCWCRMLSPALSQWVFSGLSYNTESECLYKCAAECQSYIVAESALRTALFSTSTLSD